MDSALDTYLRDMHLACRYLSPEEEVACARAYAGGKGDKEAGQLLVNSVLPMVVNIAKRYRRGTWKDEDVLLDLIQVGNQGAMHAAIRFAPEDFGTRFTTYATWWIRQRISRYMKEVLHLIHVPVNQQGEASEENEDGVPNGKKYREHAKAARRLVSLDYQGRNSAGEEMLSLHELIDSKVATPPEECDRRERNEILLHLMRWLPGAWRTVIELRLEGKTLEDIASDTGISRERVRQLEDRAIGCMIRHARRFEAKRREKSLANRVARYPLLADVLLGESQAAGKTKPVATKDAGPASTKHRQIRGTQTPGLPERRYYVWCDRFRKAIDGQGAGHVARNFIHWMKRTHGGIPFGEPVIFVSLYDFGSSHSVEVPIEKARLGLSDSEPVMIGPRRKCGRPRKVMAQ